MRRGCPRRWVAEPALPASAARGLPAAPPALCAGPAGRLSPSPRHPRGDRESLRFRRRCRSPLKGVRWAAGPAPAAPPAATGGCRAGELGGDGAQCPGFPGASGRWAFSTAGPALPPQPARLPPGSARVIAVRVCVRVRACARARGAVCTRGVRGSVFVCVRVGVSAWLALAKTHTHSHTHNPAGSSELEDTLHSKMPEVPGNAQGSSIWRILPASS